mgnify:CR=1 FL=1
MKKIKKTSELMWLLGMIFMSLGVCLCKKSGLGVSMIAAPTFILQEFLHPLSSFFSVGVTEYLTQGAILIILCIVVRKFDWRYLLAFAVAVLYGYCLDLWILIIGIEPLSSVALNWLILLLGDVCVSFGVACYFRTYFPLQIHELFVAEVSATYKKSVTKVKWIYDVCCLLLSAILALSLFGDVKTFDWSKIYAESYHSIGLATLITTFINAPLIKLFGILLDKFFDPTPLMPKFARLIERKPKSDKTEQTPDANEQTADVTEPPVDRTNGEEK